MKTSPFITGSDEKDFIIRAGICNALVYTSMTNKKAVTNKLNIDSPSGVSHPWTLSKPKRRENNPFPCSEIKGNFHYVFEC